MFPSRLARTVVCLLGLLGVLADSNLDAQEEKYLTWGRVPSQLNQPDTFGSSLTCYTLSSAEFTPYGSTMGHTFMGNSARRQSLTVPAVFVAPVQLPAGAIIEMIEGEGCDVSTGEVRVFLYSSSTDFATGLESFLSLGGGSTGTAAAVGCGFMSAPVNPPVIVDNHLNQYLVWVTLTGAATTSFAAVRLYYRLQVSPTPLTATFNDVPVGHPFHRFVEAFARAGITGGCGPSIFCPDQPVTRGQMAVFLSVALGLHWIP
jgi:hypothetical protein